MRVLDITGFYIVFEFDSDFLQTFLAGNICVAKSILLSVGYFHECLISLYITQEFEQVFVLFNQEALNIGSKTTVLWDTGYSCCA